MRTPCANEGASEKWRATRRVGLHTTRGTARGGPLTSRMGCRRRWPARTHSAGSVYRRCIRQDATPIGTKIIDECAHLLPFDFSLGPSEAVSIPSIKYAAREAREQEYQRRESDRLEELVGAARDELDEGGVDSNYGQTISTEL